MSRTDLEDQVANVLNRQANSLDPSRLTATEVIARHPSPASSDEAAPTLLRRRRLLAAAAAVLVIAGLAIGGTRLTADPEPVSTAEPAPTEDPAAGTGVEFVTPQVTFSADDLWVETGGKQYRPTAEVMVSGSPGYWGAYTTLELTWFDHGDEMRVSLSLVSDGTDWWVYQANTYGVGPNPEWQIVNGEWFRSKVDSPATGDADIGELHLRGVSLLAFATPQECVAPTVPFALIPGFDPIVAGVTNDSVGFTGSTTLISTSTCRPVTVDDITFETASDDPNIALLTPADDIVDPSTEDSDLQVGVTRFDANLAQPGKTKVQVTATRDDTGEVIAETDINIEVQDSSASAQASEPGRACAGEATIPADAGKPQKPMICEDTQAELEETLRKGE